MHDHDHDEEGEAEKYTVFNVGYEFYLRGRPDPLMIFHRLAVPTEMYEDMGVLGITEMAEGELMALMDSSSEKYLFFCDERFNRTIIIKDRVDAFSLLAPDGPAQL